MCLMYYLNCTSSSYSAHDKPKPIAAIGQASWLAKKCRTGGPLLTGAHEIISSWGCGRTASNVLSSHKLECIFIKYPFSPPFMVKFSNKKHYLGCKNLQTQG